MKSEWTQELRADAWAGCALGKSDLSSNDLAEALTAVSKYPPSNDSNWSPRVPALRLGYIRCGGDGSQFDRRCERTIPGASSTIVVAVAAHRFVERNSH
jgi:hypothetical protein